MAVSNPQLASLSPGFEGIRRGLEQRADLSRRRGQTSGALGVAAAAAPAIADVAQDFRQQKRELEKEQRAFERQMKVEGRTLVTPDLINEFTEDLKKEGIEVDPGEFSQFSGLYMTPQQMQDLATQKLRQQQIDQFSKTFEDPQQQEAARLDPDKAIESVLTGPGDESAQFVGTTDDGKAVMFLPKSQQFRISELPGGGPLTPRTDVPRRQISDSLRAQFLRESSDFKKISDAFQRVQDTTANPSPAGDIALIFNFMKMLDPNSVVRESEFATAENAGNIPQRIRAQYNKLLRGEGRLSERQRQDFVNQSKNLFLGQEQNHSQRESEFSRIAASSGVPADNVVVELRPSFLVKERKEGKKTKAKTFKSVEDVQKAKREGKIKIGDTVEIEGIGEVEVD